MISKGWIVIALWAASIQHMNAQGSGKWLNAGQSGNTSRDLLDRVDHDVLAFHPDWVIIMVGTNDMLNSKKRVSLEDYTDNLMEITRRISSNGSTIILMSPPPVDEIYLRQRHPGDSADIAPNDRIDAVRMRMKQLAVDSGYYYFDLNKAFSDRNLPAHNSDLFIRNKYNSGLEDGVHLTSLGYRFMASALYQFIKKETAMTEDQSVLCFGDSLTKGVGDQQRAEDSLGGYPGYLREFLGQ
ncbi:hypothetical protein GCM10007049_01580 [Echinicola pacifica]|uniref:SGNH hydrolase-type esterase domain-containing protein n=1 Tax=Echinicola pacifica TaxID=346377 RepID=A0A918PJX5_9BACT|nr:GDSL-type esterase/lipase family protein [Echinicola pacifica]GGZ13453.1 hypothetical protein GCM10007049_01580 [Echinicola pacifica]